jgi:hypothetical protein
LFEPVSPREVRVACSSLCIGEFEQAPLVLIFDVVYRIVNFFAKFLERAFIATGKNGRSGQYQ